MNHWARGRFFTTSPAAAGAAPADQTTIPRSDQHVFYTLFTNPWIRHNAWRILIASYAGRMGYAGAGALVELPFWFEFLFNVVWMAAALIAAIAMLQHDLGPLCERCMAEMPLDPSAKAERYRRNLATIHWISDHLRSWLVGAALIIALVEIGLLTGRISFQHVALVFGGPGIWIFLSITRHNRLQPWCPQCPRGGGGGERRPLQPTQSPLGSLG